MTDDQPVSAALDPDPGNCGAGRDNAVLCQFCGHRHTPDGCTGDPTPADLWAGVSPAACDCDTEER